MTAVFRFTLSLIGFYLACAGFLQAREPPLRFKHYGSREGLSQHTVYSIIQDRSGFMWFGTQDGLNRFDGYEFKVYRNDPNDPRSLPGNYVYCLWEDDRGFIWMGFNNAGLARYDPETDQFLRFGNDPADNPSLSQNTIFAFAADHGGNLWIATVGGGLNCLTQSERRRIETDPDGYRPRFLRFRHDPNNPDSLGHNLLNALVVDQRNRLWIGARHGGLDFLDLNQLDLDRADAAAARFFHFRYDPTASHNLAGNLIWGLHLSSDGSVWASGRQGLNRLPPGEAAKDEPADMRFERYAHDPNRPGSLPHSEINGVWEDRQGRIWVGTFGGGLALMERAADAGPGERAYRTKAVYRHASDDPRSLSSDLIRSFWEDDQGNLWVGGYGGGLSVTSIYGDKFELVDYRPDGSGLSHPDITAIAQRGGEMWIGAYGGGLTIWPMDDQAPSSSRVVHLTHDPNEETGLSDNLVRAIAVDRNRVVWAATETKGLDRVELPESAGADDLAKAVFTNYRHRADDPESLTSNHLMSLCVDRQNRLWIGSDNGLNLYVPTADSSRDKGSSGRFKRFRNDPGEPSSLSSNSITSLFEDRQGVLWAGTIGDGLNRLRQADYADGSSWRPGEGAAPAETPDRLQFDRYLHRPGDAASLAGNVIWTIHQDSRDRIWVGASGGLSRLEPDGRSFRSYAEADGMPNRVVRGIVEDDQGFLWISTNMGLSRFNPARETFRNYDLTDGLQDREFRPNARFKDSDGRLYFGGVNGLNRFHPAKIFDDPIKPRVALTELLLFNRRTRLARFDSESPLAKPIEKTQTLTLSPEHKVVSFKFAALHYRTPEKNRFRYRLERFDQDWTYAEPGQRTATYTNLDPGTYTFRIQASNPDGAWSQEGVALEVQVLPPLWRSWWAHLLYGLALIGLIGVLAGYQKRKLVFERRVNDQLRQLDKMKNDFMANTSHELRTPLNGIIGLAESLREETSGILPRSARDNLAMIISSGQRLYGVIEEILDFAKIRSKALKIKTKAVDLRDLADVALTLIKPLAASKALTLANDIPKDLPPADADEKRLLQILHHLLENAVKFTDQGVIRIEAAITGSRIEVQVADSGIGIAEDQFGRIFQPFSQGDAPPEQAYNGAGLGLSIARQLVRLHDGELTVRSQPGHGSVFSFTLSISAQKTPAPLSEEPQLSKIQFFPKTNPEPEAGALHSPQPSVDAPTPTKEDELFKPEDFHILIVDDERINRRVLENFLSKAGYRLSQATEGQEAIEAISRGDVDLVLLDIMMPRISGYEVCRIIREKYPRQALPVIFLTAKNQVDDLVQGFAMGANDYLAKPILKGELLSRVKTHLELLHLYRDLESKVYERTHQLDRRNLELADRCQELETLDDIVKAINHELELPKLAKSLLSSAKSLFPQTERASFLLRNEDDDRFYLAAADGYTPKTPNALCLSEDEVVVAYAPPELEREAGVFIALGPRITSRRTDRETWPAPESRIAMTIPVDDGLTAVLSLDNHSDPEAFRESDGRKLARFREHAITAIAKALALAQLVDAQKELVDSAHVAGMAEMAAEVIHDLGNTFNSVKTSIQIIQELTFDTQGTELLKKIGAMLHDRETSPDHQRRPQPIDRVPETLVKTASSLEKRSERIRLEAHSLAVQMERIQMILKAQQRFVRLGDRVQELDINKLIQSWLRREAPLLRDRRLTLHTKLERGMPPVKANRAKTSRVLQCLLKNAIESIETWQSPDQGRIEIHTHLEGEAAIVEICDNGVGIEPGDSKRLFCQGFADDNQTASFSLHYCANAMRDMSGSIHISSEGPGEGCAIRLSFQVAASAMALQA